MSSTTKTDVNRLSETISKQLTGYYDELTRREKKAVDIVAKEIDAEIRAHVRFKGNGEYVKAFRVKKIYEDQYQKKKAWYVKAPHYRLTHLLEDGHDVIRNGIRVGRAKAYPHIRYGAQLAHRRMIELTKEAVDDAGK